MRFGNWRGASFAIVLVSAAFAGAVAKAELLGFGHHFPKVVPAMDYRTGGQYFAPPIPYGHYAKDNDFGTGKLIGGLKGHLSGLTGGLHSGGGLGHGSGHGDGGCSDCGDGGHGHGLGLGTGHGLGFGHGSSGLFSKHHAAGCDSCGVLASAQAPAKSIPSPQASAQSPCGSKGCGATSHHHHGSNAGCGLCGGGGRGIGFGHKFGCGNCGGRGCGSCMGAGLGSKAHGLLNGLLHPHAGKVQYFVGPGGPVPITPGYVPYVITTRSPRDFFAFPPFTPER